MYTTVEIKLNELIRFNEINQSIKSIRKREIDDVRKRSVSHSEVTSIDHKASHSEERMLYVPFHDFEENGMRTRLKRERRRAWRTNAERDVYVGVGRGHKRK